MAAVVAVAFMAVTGVAVYAWQHGQIRERDAALAAALQDQNEARQEAGALRADADLSTAEIRALEAHVGRLELRVERLRSTVNDLNWQLGAIRLCNAADMLAAIRAQVDIATPMIWDSVSVQECQGGYARVFAHPGNVPAGSHVEDSEQVFLKNAGGAWIVVASGTGITCYDADLPPELAQACAELETRDPASSD